MKDSLTTPRAALAGPQFLHTPGPTHVPDAVREAMGRQCMDLSDPRLADLIEDCEAGLARLLGTRHADVLMYAANGHGAWEATIANLVAPGAQVLVAGSGHFAEAWAVHAEAMGARALRTPTRPGQALDPAAIETALRADTAHRIAAVFAVHTDTASGVTSDIAAVRRAMDASGHPALLVADVIASLGATPFRMDEWGVNVAIGASQKALMGPPGLSFTAVDARAMQAAQANPTPRAYWDWAKRKSDLLYRKFCGTPPQSLLAGMRAALDLIAAEGEEAVFARHRRVANAVHAAVNAWSQGGALKLFVEDPAARAVSVTTISVADGVDVEAMRTVARERFHVAVAGGLGPLAGRMFRIGHLGDVHPAMILGALGGVDAALRACGIPVGDGALQGAVKALQE
ncbi:MULTISPECIES: alanine--glyoxylate aminotransferase family protein [Achromobacter]|uniref:pyridoxal-phosphate-dependent aminotransferase family protein n=1 Tax=Achromobacter TaxID=222 RepID=UPI0025C2F2DF|nr:MULTISPECIES: aminotransferase class V-fold PLP-dependent enzyme [Achromobacter]